MPSSPVTNMSMLQGLAQFKIVFHKIQRNSCKSSPGSQVFRLALHLNNINIYSDLITELRSVCLFLPVCKPNKIALVYTYVSLYSSKKTYVNLL